MVDETAYEVKTVYHKKFVVTVFQGIAFQRLNDELIKSLGFTQKEEVGNEEVVLHVPKYKPGEYVDPEFHPKVYFSKTPFEFFQVLRHFLW